MDLYMWFEKIFLKTGVSSYTLTITNVSGVSPYILNITRKSW